MFSPNVDKFMVSVEQEGRWTCRRSDAAVVINVRCDPSSKRMLTRVFVLPYCIVALAVLSSVGPDVGVSVTCASLCLGAGSFCGVDV